MTLPLVRKSHTVRRMSCLKVMLTISHIKLTKSKPGILVRHLPKKEPNFKLVCINKTEPNWSPFAAWSKKLTTDVELTVKTRKTAVEI